MATPGHKFDPFLCACGVLKNWDALRLAAVPVAEAFRAVRVELAAGGGVQFARIHASSAIEAALKYAAEMRHTIEQATPILDWPKFIPDPTVPKRPNREARRWITQQLRAVQKAVAAREWPSFGALLTAMQGRCADVAKDRAGRKSFLSDEPSPIERHGFALVPGGFRWRGGKRQELRSKPLEMLRLLLATSDCRRLATSLRDAIWDDEVTPIDTDQAVKDTATDLREALRKAIRAAGLQPGRSPLPLPSSGKLKDLTYTIVMPDLPDDRRR